MHHSKLPPRSFFYPLFTPIWSTSISQPLTSSPHSWETMKSNTRSLQMFLNCCLFMLHHRAMWHAQRKVLSALFCMLYMSSQMPMTGWYHRDLKMRESMRSLSLETTADFAPSSPGYRRLWHWHAIASLSPGTLLPAFYCRQFIMVGLLYMLEANGWKCESFLYNPNEIILNSWSKTGRCQTAS